MITTKRHRGLIKAAFRRAAQNNWLPIRPIGKAKSFCDPACFTRGHGKIYGGRLQFWFEDSAGSSHIIIEELNLDTSHLPN